MSKLHVIGGGTFSHVRNHLALAAPAFGGTARYLTNRFLQEWNRDAHDYQIFEHLTRMADHMSKLVTNDDVAALLDELVADPETRVIIMNAALCDFDGRVNGEDSGPHATRLQSRLYSDPLPPRQKSVLDEQKVNQPIWLRQADKLIGRIRKERKDIHVVGFKTTTNASPDEQYAAGLHLLKANSLNLVLANDTVTRNNMVITPEEARYFEGTDRNASLDGLVQMVLSRSRNTFTRSTVVDGPPVAWDDPAIPANLRRVVEHCIERGAYKPFRGATVGHFAAKLDERTIVTSRRKRDFNRLPEEGMVHVEYEGDDRVIARGGKPSVGGQSQRAIFRDHPELDCIVHFHSPLKTDAADTLPVVPQWPNECGSHQCGQATSNGLRSFSNGAPLKAVMLDNHGPNIVFSRETPAETVIEFIERNFALEDKTGGLVA